MADAPEPKDFKATLNLPQTEFPMKGNLSVLEPKLLAWWKEQGTYQKVLAQNASSTPFVFHDGPPYANGHAHIGHALNRILKDIVVRYRNLRGQLCDFVPGWDCHGLPIEQAVEKRLREKKIDRRTLGRDEFLEQCRAYATEFVSVQREELARLGLFGDWEHPYLTLAFDYEAQEIRELAKIASKGLLYRRKKPVYWCLVDQTALAEAEVEYEDHESPSVYVAFREEDPGKLVPTPKPHGEKRTQKLAAAHPALAGKDVDFVIWTTTPWTLPANLAVAVHPELEYVFYDLGPRVLCVAKDLLPQVLGQIAPEHMALKDVQLKGETVSTAALVEPARILHYALGKDLEGYAYRHPFIDRVSPVILGEHVTLEAGTGLVHTAPGHGQEDYEVGLQYGLDVYNPVKNDGKYDETVHPESLVGLSVFDPKEKKFPANARVIELLVEKGVLLNRASDGVKHSYPHCWRCHNPIIFRGTNQWFIALDDPKNQLRKAALAQVDATQWVPRWGHDRIHSMLEGRPDWCISRQRTWGVPIPVALCEDCETPVVSPPLMEKVADAVEKEGVGVWYRTPVAEFLPADFACPSCGKKSFRRETDILDVWFDSASSFAAVVDKRPHLQFPADLYLEGSDQHRGWFHSSLLVATATRGRAPYKSVLTHGFVVDGTGKKMSKSLGNTLAPEKVIQQYGAEVLRLWVASSDYRDDIRVSDQILKGLSEGYRKIRNTLRYALSNLYDFDPAQHAVKDEALAPLDRWARARLGDLVGRVEKAYESYEFHQVFHSVVDFCGNDLSAVYFDISKDRLYTFKSSGPERRSAQTVLFEIARDLLRLLAPVMAFTSEEAWQLLPGKHSESIFLAGFPTAGTAGDPALMERYQRLFAVRSAVQKHLEAARRDKVIGASLEAKVVLSGKDLGFLEAARAELPGLFIVSQVEISRAEPGEKAQPVEGVVSSGTLYVEIRGAEGAKCPRCWTYAVEVERGQGTCDKCLPALGA